RYVASSRLVQRPGEGTLPLRHAICFSRCQTWLTVSLLPRGSRFGLPLRAHRFGTHRARRSVPFGAHPVANPECTSRLWYYARTHACFVGSFVPSLSPLCSPPSPPLRLPPHTPPSSNASSP